MSEQKCPSAVDSQEDLGDPVDLSEEKSVDGSLRSEDVDFLASDEDEENAGSSDVESLPASPVPNVQADLRGLQATLASTTVGSLAGWNHQQRHDFLSSVCTVIPDFVSAFGLELPVLPRDLQSFSQLIPQYRLRHTSSLESLLHQYLPRSRAITASRLQMFLHSVVTSDLNLTAGIEFERFESPSSIDALLLFLVLASIAKGRLQMEQK